jgi:uncharacterized membrane protein (UPF0127 family)
MKLAIVAICVAVIVGALVIWAQDGEQAVPFVADDARIRFEGLSDQIGRTCRVDAECDAPLRCLDLACNTPPAMTGQSTAETPSVLFYAGAGEVQYYLELAKDDAERRRGLMFRPWMQEDWGMIFLYPDERPLSFWMQNTFIPLDMVFVDSDAMVVGVVANAEPLTTTSRAVEGVSQYVIELNGGQAALHGIEAGVRCELLNLPDPAQAP